MEIDSMYESEAVLKNHGDNTQKSQSSERLLQGTSWRIESYDLSRSGVILRRGQGFGINPHQGHFGAKYLKK